MALHLVVDNTDYHNYLGNLMRAALVATSSEPLPADMRDLLLAMDLETVEHDMAVANAIGL
jgi:hypothetical protein